EGAGIMPDLTASRWIDGKGLVSGSHIHDPVGHYRRDFEPPGVRNGEKPFRSQFRYISGIDLFEPTIAVAVEAPMVSRPIAGFGIDEAREWHSHPQRFRRV